VAYVCYVSPLGSKLWFECWLWLCFRKWTLTAFLKLRWWVLMKIFILMLLVMRPARQLVIRPFNGHFQAPWVGCATGFVRNFAFSNTKAVSSSDGWRLVLNLNLARGKSLRTLRILWLSNFQARKLHLILGLFFFFSFFSYHDLFYLLVTLLVVWDL